jgi:hypothetical protein
LGILIATSHLLVGHKRSAVFIVQVKHDVPINQLQPCDHADQEITLVDQEPIKHGMINNIPRNEQHNNTSMNSRLHQFEKDIFYRNNIWTSKLGRNVKYLSPSLSFPLGQRDAVTLRDTDHFRIPVSGNISLLSENADRLDILAGKLKFCTAGIFF